MSVFGPKGADHPSVGKECHACHKPFAAGDYTTLVALGPGDDPEAQKRARDERPYNAVAVEVHFSCATGRDGADAQLADARMAARKAGKRHLQKLTAPAARKEWTE